MYLKSLPREEFTNIIFVLENLRELAEIDEELGIKGRKEKIQFALEIFENYTTKTDKIRKILI